MSTLQPQLSDPERGPGGDLAPGRFVVAETGADLEPGDYRAARWQSYAGPIERAEAIRRVIDLARTDDEGVQAEYDLQLLGVNPVELFFAVMADPT